MATIIRNRTIRPSSRATTSKSYKVDTKNIGSGDTLIVNIDHESKGFAKQFKFNGSELKAKKSISFRVHDYGTEIQIMWSGATSKPSKAINAAPKKIIKKETSAAKTATIGDFEGFIKVKDLRMDYSLIPDVRGVYKVLNPKHKSPEYINPGVGGFFKGKDPNVPIEVLKTNEVQGIDVVYIGKAGGPESSATLRSRLKQYLKFGDGKNVGHRGGRYIWQLANHEELVFCWMKLPKGNPREVEKRMIAEFVSKFGKRPYANLVS